MGGEGEDGGIRRGEASNQLRCVPSAEGEEEKRGEANQYQTGSHDATLHGVVFTAVVVTDNGCDAHAVADKERLQHKLAIDNDGYGGNAVFSD